MAWGLWNKIKSGIKKIPNLFRKYKPIVDKVLTRGIDLVKRHKDKLQRIGPLKKIDLDKAIDITEQYIHPIFKS